MDKEITIRRLVTNEEYVACVELQKSTWGENFTDLVAPAILKVSQFLGGVTAGAFDRNGELVGFVFGMTGYRNGLPVHWSDMLAVQTGLRGMGIGKELKLFQRAEMLKIGVKEIFWTYDPLEARNANLNFNGLGAVIEDYVENMYVSDDRSILHSGIGTDRFVVKWMISDEQVIKLLEGEESKKSGKFEKIPVVNAIGGDLPDVPEVRVEIPSDIQEVKRRSSEEGFSWREKTRRIFTCYLGRGYRVTAFYRDSAAKKWFYLCKK